jgi:hypothetical protein
MVCKVSDNSDGKSRNSQQSLDYSYYYLKIVSPYEIEARHWSEQKARLDSMTKSMVDNMQAEMMSEIKEDEGNEITGNDENVEEENYFDNTDEELVRAVGNKPKQPAEERQYKTQE